MQDSIVFSKPALERQRLGLFSAADFRLTSGQDALTPKAALWYFRDEVIAVPKKANAASLIDDQNSVPHPVLIWVGAPELLESVTLSPRGEIVRTMDGQAIRFALTPKIPSNRSYYDQTTTDYFQNRTLRIRGGTVHRDGTATFAARTIWPEDFRIDPDSLLLHRCPDSRALANLITAQIDKAQGPLFARLLWERHTGPPRRWAGYAALAFVLSGAQGDDDEAHGGHLSIATGWFGHRGEWCDWLVNNFYPLDQESEKGILAATLPMDNYLMDLNSGQSYYRPCYLLVVLLRRARTACIVQAAIQQVLYRFYRHDLLYDHAKMNSTRMTVDPLRRIGWQIPHRGHTGFLKAVLASLLNLVKESSFQSGKTTFNYLIRETTQVLPRVAFEAAALDLLEILENQPARPLTSYERMLQSDVEAVVFVRVPQIPSSRAFGTYPVSSFEEYRLRVPADRSEWQTAPQKPRPFPPHLRGAEGTDKDVY